VRVRPALKLAVLTTGNEIVPVDVVPKAGQIRNSNGPMLEAMAKQLGAAVVSLGAARDEENDLRALISHGLQADVLVISGGVSAGVLDLVPGVLTQLGVRQVFHKVNVKPGKPVWFGVFPREAGRSTLVFGLPGNPVSSFVCFELFVRHALNQLSAASPLAVQRARLSADHAHRGERPTYLPATLRFIRNDSEVVLLPSKGSGDLKTLADADCLAHFPGPERVYTAGEEVGVYLL
jgi:molybdopterin molybdotransferase